MLDPDDQVALEASVRASVLQVSDVQAFDVTVEAVSGICARVRVADTAGALTPLMGFASKQSGEWCVLSLGTGFETAFYHQHGIPAALQLG
ncbi:MAG: hypothetical protein VKP62_16820 [Candidatus Sericytochromatia bacterium]|nr:hypothetical protein [Candidatus Sericytochromatia bacterium]